MARRGTKKTALIALIADEDTATGFLLAGIGNVDTKRNANWFIVGPKTKHADVEEAFQKYSKSDNVGILLISQVIADSIRYLIEQHDRLLPTILEIPTKDHPYDVEKDSIMTKINRMMSAESISPIN